MKVYEHELGPRLRELPPKRVVVADGFSCKTQIEQATGRRPLHLAQLLQRAKHNGSALHNDGLEDERSGNSAWMKKGALILGAAALGVGALYGGRRILR